MSKVAVKNFAQYPSGSESSHLPVETIPDILGGKALRSVAQSMRGGKSKGVGILAGIGGHVIKAGCGPLLIGLMRDGLLTGLAGNGSVLVHDFEIAYAGQTSEDVDAALPDGSFGVTEETGRYLNEAAQRAYKTGEGLGATLGQMILDMNLPYAEYSVLAQARKLGVPFTCHVSIGCDVWHLHPTADGAAIGAASMTDFRTFCDLVAGLNDGGVYLNIGSAVVMPEVFLKAVTVVRNLGYPLKDFTTANFDFIQHYRPLTNVVRRPVAGVGKGYAITGPHEILLPLLCLLLKSGPDKIEALLLSE
ncbi:MAG: hypothetical protein WBS54_09580 [Acidobacteriota bacterium]